MKKIIIVIACFLIASCAGAPSTKPASPEAQKLVRMAERAEESSKYDMALGLYTRAHELDSDYAQPLIGLGEILRRRGKHDDAIKAYERAILLEPENTVALRGYGNVLIAQGNPERAALQLERVLKIKKEPRTYSSLGVAYDMIGQHQKAQATYKKGLRMEADDMVMKNNLAISYALAKNFDKAIETMQEVAAHPGARLRERKNLALIYGLAANEVEARKVLAKDFAEPVIDSTLAFYRKLRAMKGSVDIVKELYSGDKD